jgi:stage III sporulation protein AG
VKGQEWLKRWLGEGKRGRVTGWLLIAGLVGAAAMILNSYITIKDADSIPGIRESPPSGEAQAFSRDDRATSEYEDFEARYESAIRDILQKIAGVGEVDVLVTIDSTEELVVERHMEQRQQTTNEKDSEGGTRQISDMSRSGQVVLVQAKGDQSPLVIKRIRPQIRGVVVVAEGAENLTVKKLIAEAVERGLGVPAHRISVIPGKK